MKKRAYSTITNLLLLLLIANCPLLSVAQSTISITNESDINTAFQEYSPAFYKNGLVFIGSNPAVAEDKKTDDETGKKATSFFLAMRGDNGGLKKVIPFAEELTTKFYDGPLSFNADGSFIYFTRSNLRRGKAIKSKDGLVKLKIYSAEKTENGWINITDLPLNLPDYDCTHPSLSPDGKRLYFASNRPDGFGGMDLYVCTLLNGKWSIPVNCGPKVNTAKNEIFPFIHADGTLYFTSNGREGLGNLDIFYTMKTDTGWLTPKALPEPINSASDDFGLIVSADKKSGYFSSNRASGKGDDDIYSFNAPDNVNETVLAITETEAPAQTEDTEAATAIINRVAPLSLLVASNDLSPLKNMGNTEGGIKLPKIQIQPSTPIKKEEIQADNSEMPAETVATIEKPAITNAPKAEIKVDNGEMPAEKMASVEKAEPVQPTPNISKTEVKIGKNEKPNAVVADTKKQKTTPPKVDETKKQPEVALDTKKQKTPQPLPNNRKVKVQKSEKPTESTTATADKREPFSEAENAGKRRNDWTEVAFLPLLNPTSVVSIEKRVATDLANLLPRGYNKVEKTAEKPQIIADNKPSVSPLEIPKQPLNPIEKPPVEATRSEPSFEEPATEVATIVPAKEKIKAAIQEIPKEETLLKVNKSIVEKEEINNTPTTEPFITEVQETKPIKVDNNKVEKGTNTAVEVKKSEANGTVRKKYLVVVGTYSERYNAVIQRKKANTKGYNDAEIVQYAQNHLFGVCVLQSDDEKSAQALARDINKSKGMEAFVKVLK